ncbi:MAG: ATP-binding protein [Candidatus Melainabacteria bacterium]|nr:ATP-binding protein [Candidatus Melainabacteria bacterium]
MLYKSQKRIVIIGPAGTGKTTIAKIISKKLNIKLIPEQARIICSQLGYKSIYQIQNPNNFRFLVLNSQIKLEEKHKEFLSDRSAIDCWVHWLRWSAASAKTDETERYYLQAYKQALKYSQIIYVPLIIKPRNDGFRWNNKDYQLQLHRLFLATLDSWQLMPRTYFIQSKNIKDRIKEIISFINN